jgi:hypothetical protein
VALFSIVMGIAMLLVGAGFVVLTLSVLHVPAKTRDRKAAPAAQAAPVS